MAIGTGGLLPGVADVFGVPEGEALPDLPGIHPVGTSLDHYVMAQGTVAADGLAGLGPVGAVMAAEASLVVQVPYVVGVGLPIHLHLREDVLRELSLQPRDRPFHQRPLAVVQRRVVRLVKLQDAGTDRLHRLLLRAVGRRGELQSKLLDPGEAGGNAPGGQGRVDELRCGLLGGDAGRTGCARPWRAKP